MSTSRKSLDELSIADERVREIEAMGDEEIDTSDIPELDDAFWDTAEVRFPADKDRLTELFGQLEWDDDDDDKAGR